MGVTDVIINVILRAIIVVVSKGTNKRILNNDNKLLLYKRLNNLTKINGNKSNK